MNNKHNAEVSRYLDAYRSFLTPDVMATYRTAARQERVKIKNDAEYKAAIVAPVAQGWYDTVRRRMGIYRKSNANGKEIPDWNKILEDEAARHGMMILQGLGQIFSAHAAPNVADEKQPPLMESAAPVEEPIELPDAASILSRASVPLQDGKQRYLNLAQNYSLLPPDAVVATLLGYSRQKVNRIRNELESQGYEFATADLPEWAYSERETWWRIVKRPIPESIIKAELTSKLTTKIESLSSAELKTLLELLG